MFDLFRSRDKAVRILLGGLLLVVALSMLTYLVPSYESAASGNGTVVATVGNQNITTTDVERRVQQLTRGRQMPQELIPNYIPTIIQEMITERAIQYEAARQGFEVTDAQLSQTIQQTAPALFPDGRFVGKQAYAAMLAEQNTTIEEFEAAMRRDILAARLHDVAVEGTIVTPLEIELAYRQKNEKIKVGYVKITNEKYKAEATPTDADIRQYYQNNLNQYQSKEKKTLTLLVADQAKLEKDLTAPEADLRLIYNKNQDQYHVPEQVKVQHILFMTQGKPPDQDAKSKAQAEDVLNQIKKGADFTAMVDKYSEDPGKTENHGEYTVQRDSQMDDAFKKAAFDQKVGEIEIIKSQFGYHIVKVLKHDQAHLQTFDEVKSKLADDWKKSQVNGILQAATDKVATALQASPMHPEQVAAQYHMDVVHAQYEPGQTIPEVGPSPDFDQAVQQLKQGQVSPAVVIGQSKVVIAEVTGTVPPAPQPFEAVKDQIKDLLSRGRMTSAIHKHATELIDKAKSMGGNLEAAAKSMGLEYHVTDAFTRTDTVAGFGSATYVDKAFGMQDGAILDSVLMPDATVICKVIEHVPADMSKLNEQRAEIRDQIKRKKATDRSQMFDEGLREHLVKDGKIKAHQDVIQKLIAQYRAG